MKKQSLAIYIGLGIGFWLVVLSFRSFLLNAIPAYSDTAIIFVATTGSDNPDCGTVSAPCASIQYAVDLTQDNDTVQVAQGVYGETVALSKTIHLLGGYNPLDWTRDITNYTTVISGNQAGSVVQITDGSAATIEGFHIVDGWASMGGGVYIHNASPTVTRNNINHNTTSSGGAGVYIGGNASPIIANNLIANNQITGYYHGAGIYAGYGTGPQIVNNTISYNVASRGWGGGIYVVNSSAAITYNDIHHNQVGGAAYTISDGGGIHVESTTGVIHHNHIHDNSAYDDGGGVFLKSFVELSDNIIENNSTINGNGAGIAIWGAQTTGNVDRNKITHNNGEGVYVWGSANPSFTANVIADNTADGVFVYGASSRMFYSTVARNNGSGVLVSLNSAVVLTNTIMVDHANGVTVDADSEAVLDGVLWFNTTANVSGTGTINVTNAIAGDPRFAADGYHLTSLSAAIDGGVSTAPSVDIDGATRPLDGNLDGVALPDLGADEFGFSVSLPIVIRE